MADYKRSDRVADLIHREIANLLYRGIKDPRLGQVTITAVEVSDDLRHARVFYTFLGESSEKELISKALHKAQGFIRRELGKRLHLRVTPEISFRYDTSFEYGSKIENLLKELHTDE